MTRRQPLFPIALTPHREAGVECVACGSSVRFGTDGDGRCLEVCPRCGPSSVVRHVGTAPDRQRARRKGLRR